MEVRAQVSMVFHLDKCIGCHTCSVACKNVWTDRPGAEYMWWNNVETRPGTGYPARWEDQEAFRGGFERRPDGQVALRSQGRLDGLLKVLYNPPQPGLDDYYEPWTYRYADLVEAPAGQDQPTAVPVSQITGRPIDVAGGPNWDDDLSGSPLYAARDPNLAGLTEDERRALFDVEGMAMAYLPRICNHCANPACVAACPSGALYKRGEDGLVLVDQERCRGWRACVVACPYKKIFYNWKTGKSEKCILCYPRLETGEPPACFHSCVGRIRYLGVLLYDASRLTAAMAAPDAGLVEAQRALLLDPHDPEVARAAEDAGIAAGLLDAARRSPVYRYVVEWGIALPLHPEFRTLPMLFYVPPLLPVVGRQDGGVYTHQAAVDGARIPLRYLASLFAAGDVETVRAVMRRLLAVRAHRRAVAAGGPDEASRKALRDAGLTEAQADAIYRLTALGGVEDRFVLPPMHREDAAAVRHGSAEACKGCVGFGPVKDPVRGA